MTEIRSAIQFEEAVSEMVKGMMNEIGVHANMGHDAGLHSNGYSAGKTCYTCENKHADVFCDIVRLTKQYPQHYRQSAIFEILEPAILNPTSGVVWVAMCHLSELGRRRSQ